MSHRLMGLKIYNTLSGQKDEFIPLSEAEVRMYVCGVTVYGSSHVGHARALVTFDVVYRYLKFLGFQVTFVRNFTDVDDKIIQRANAEGATAQAIAARYIAEFQKDSEALGLFPPTQEPKATEHIPEIIALIRRLEEKGMAYRVDGDVFFPVSAFPGYGKLSRKRLEDLEAGARIEIDERKRHPMDFALWKASKEGEPSWESPWGSGRPGWHIECSAMSTKYLGQPFDIHGGGMDLIFPHHENEIAQSEAACGVPFARYWMHNELLQIHQKKMSKSLGNFVTIREILEQHEAVALRHYFLTSHYRSPMDFSEEGLEEAERAVERIYEALERGDSSGLNGAVQPEPALIQDFRREMDDDFNTPRALALIFDEIRSLNRISESGKSTAAGPRAAAVKKMGEVLGILQVEPRRFFEGRKDRWMRRQGFSPEILESLIRQRERARQEKRWQEADRIRRELQDKGVVLEDTAEGTVWKVR